MVVVFKSRIAGDITMFEEDAKRILDLFGKQTKEGIITAAETGKLIDLLEEKIVLQNEFEEQLKQRSDVPEIEDPKAPDADRDADNEEEVRVEAVRFGARAYPLLDLLKRAHREGADIVWREEVAHYL